MRRACDSEEERKRRKYQAGDRRRELHPEIDAMYERQRNAKTQEERVEIIQDMARRFWEVQAGSVPMWWAALRIS